MTKPTLLVVEDKPVQQMVIKALAERFGYDVQAVSNGDEAIDALSCCSTAYCAILMDLTLAEMNGMECTRKIRELEAGTGRRIPIIAVTARAQSGDREKAIAAGMDDYLAKPFTADDFRSILLRWAYDPNKPNLRILPGSSDNQADHG